MLPCSLRPALWILLMYPASIGTASDILHMVTSFFHRSEKYEIVQLYLRQIVIIRHQCLLLSQYNHACKLTVHLFVYYDMIGINGKPRDSLSFGWHIQFELIIWSEDTLVSEISNLPYCVFLNYIMLFLIKASEFVSLRK